jgi:hypothetical protein
LDAEFQVSRVKKLFGGGERDAELTGYFFVAEEFGQEIECFNLTGI